MRKLGNLARMPVAFQCSAVHAGKFSTLLVGLTFLLSSVIYPIAQIPDTPDDQAEIMNLGNPINSFYSEYTPFITPDEKYLFFQSNRPGGVGVTGDYDLWFCLNNSAEDSSPRFSPPVNLGKPINAPFFDGHPTLRRLSNGEMEIYFTSFQELDRPGGKLTNIYRSAQKNGVWSQPEYVIEINSDFHDRMPSISADGKFLYFSSNRPGGEGKDDIWISEYDGIKKSWGTPFNAGMKINTSAAEVSPSIHNDNITLYFSSDRRGGMGGFDIYVTQTYPQAPDKSASSRDWKNPQNLGKPFNSTWDDEYPTVTRTGNFMYFTSNRQGGQGSYDIYRAKVPEFAKPQVIVTLKGRVFELISMKGIEANIKITGIDGERNLSTGLPDGNYNLDLHNDRQYKIMVTAPGYEAYEYILDLRDVRKSQIITKNFSLARSLNLPKQFILALTFVNQTGDKLSPDTTMRLLPDMTNEVILDVRKGEAEISIPAMNRYGNTANAIEEISRKQLHIDARLQGYEPLREMRYLKNIVRFDERPLPEKIKVEYVLRKKGETSEKVTVIMGGPGDLVASVYFALNIANKIKSEKASGLKKVVALYKKNPSVSVEIFGHTDKTGGVSYNKKLSKKRAEFVKRKLAEYGIPESKMATFGMASEKPAVKETSAKARARNRRVEIFFRKGKTAPASNKTEEDKLKEEEKITDTVQDDNPKEKTETEKKEKKSPAIKTIKKKPEASKKPSPNVKKKQEETLEEDEEDEEPEDNGV